MGLFVFKALLSRLHLNKEAASTTDYSLYHTIRKGLQLTMFKGSYLVGLSLMGLDGTFDTKVMLLWINLDQGQRKFCMKIETKIARVNKRSFID